MARELEVKSNRLKIRPGGERYNHGKSRAQDPNVEK